MAGAICAYFTHIDDLEALTPAVELIAHKHCSLGVQPEHYPIVGKHLIDAIKEVMGDGATDEIIGAVAEAYGVLTDVCTGRESAIYSEQVSALGGWNGLREFVVDRKVKESDLVSSFYLKPTDGQPLRKFLPGQYITLSIDHPTTPTSPRNYSLSDAPCQDYYRISVKRELAEDDSSPDGLISNFLHDNIQPGDTLQVGPPCGEFTIDATDSVTLPVVFLAGGIGVTPLLSMAKSLVAAHPLAPIYFLQAARNSAVQALGAEIEALKTIGQHVQTHVIFDEPLADDLSSGKCDSIGRVDLALVRDWAPVRDAQFYVCGPKSFMRNGLTILDQLNVDDSKIRYEFFGPLQTLATDA